MGVYLPVTTAEWFCGATAGFAKMLLDLAARAHDELADLNDDTRRSRTAEGSRLRLF